MSRPKSRITLLRNAKSENIHAERDRSWTLKRNLCLNIITFRAFVPGNREAQLLRCSVRRDNNLKLLEKFFSPSFIRAQGTLSRNFTCVNAFRLSRLLRDITFLFNGTGKDIRSKYLKFIRYSRKKIILKFLVKNNFTFFPFILKKLFGLEYIYIHRRGEICQNLVKRLNEVYNQAKKQQRMFHRKEMFLKQCSKICKESSPPQGISLIEPDTSSSRVNYLDL